MNLDNVRTLVASKYPDVYVFKARQARQQFAVVPDVETIPNPLRIGLA